MDNIWPVVGIITTMRHHSRETGNWFRFVWFGHRLGFAICYLLFLGFFFYLSWCDLSLTRVQRPSLVRFMWSIIDVDMMWISLAWTSLKLGAISIRPCQKESLPGIPAATAVTAAAVAGETISQSVNQSNRIDHWNGRQSMDNLSLFFDEPMGDRVKTRRARGWRFGLLW